MSDDQSLLLVLHDKALAALARWHELRALGRRISIVLDLNAYAADFIETMHGAQPRWDEVADWPDVFEAAHRELIQRW